jgi:hypothetical protein
MTRGLFWAVLFIAWFWVDGSFSDPAVLKDLLLPLALGGLLLVHGGRWRPNSGGWIVLVLGAWSIAWMGGCAPVDQTLLVIATGFMAFLAGATGALPPVGIAVAAAALAVAKGWDDLLFLRNIGGGIPFTPTSFFVHRNLFTLVLAPSLFLLGGWLASTPSRMWMKWLGWSIVAAGVALVLVSESRGAALGGLAGGLFPLVGWGWKPSTLRQRILMFAGLGVALVGLSVAQSGRVEQTRQELASIIRGEPINTNIPGRFRPWVWGASVRLWEASPVTGIGTGEFRYRVESALGPMAGQLPGSSCPSRRGAFSLAP